jgi:hypothetical protein
VREVKADNPEGMGLYALIEFPSETGRRYVFANWDEYDSSFLEGVADGFEVIDE